ncbi:winged helix-turn-helix transcriptional regulator [Spirosoma taeanense]|uniref:Winged helix-turn-helix transcriptional regulator n=1 Tax=Spirosoma taeanense TaxID=2735870 RepID=A0A6M5Y3V2_9BACT|nr:MarR family winged helix-turn-helix transcriptional regulator [Spirosoma taeanense]QJW88479.1 winged helix-turn-helix transcriptional regulator [Spirosoma taeanense]
MNEQSYCIAGRLRMLARVLTGRYTDAFTAEGVTFAQAGLLMRIFAQPGIRQTQLSKQLQIEKSAMSRDVQLLHRNGWLTDNLRQGLFLTESGSQLAKRCHKIWKVLNARIHDELGQEAIDALTLFSANVLTPKNQTPTPNDNSIVNPALANEPE